MHRIPAGYYENPDQTEVAAGYATTIISAAFFMIL